MAKSLVVWVGMAGAAVFAATTLLLYRENARLHGQLAEHQAAPLEKPAPQIIADTPSLRPPEKRPAREANVSRGAPFSEIAERIEALTAGSEARRTWNLRKIIADVRTEDIPRLMALIEKHVSRES